MLIFVLSTWLLNYCKRCMALGRWYDWGGTCQAQVSLYQNHFRWSSFHYMWDYQHQPTGLLLNSVSNFELVNIYAVFMVTSEFNVKHELRCVENTHWPADVQRCRDLKWKDNTECLYPHHFLLPIRIKANWQCNTRHTIQAVGKKVFNCFFFK